MGLPRWASGRAAAPTRRSRSPVAVGRDHRLPEALARERAAERVGRRLDELAQGGAYALAPGWLQRRGHRRVRARRRRAAATLAAAAAGRARPCR